MALFFLILFDLFVFQPSEYGGAFYDPSTYCCLEWILITILELIFIWKICFLKKYIERRISILSQMTTPFTNNCDGAGVIKQLFTKFKNHLELDKIVLLLVLSCNIFPRTLLCLPINFIGECIETQSGFLSSTKIFTGISSIEFLLFKCMIIFCIVFIFKGFYCADW